MEEEYVLNAHNKEEFPPAHTAEHLLNQLMMRTYNCERSNNAHIERKKKQNHLSAGPQAGPQGREIHRENDE